MSAYAYITTLSTYGDNISMSSYDDKHTMSPYDDQISLTLLDSRYEPYGEFGQIAETRLLAIPERDFEDALCLLQVHDPPATRSSSDNAVVRGSGHRARKRDGLHPLALGPPLTCSIRQRA